MVAAAEPARDPFAHLERIGVDEISLKKGQRYITVVVVRGCHLSIHVTWTDKWGPLRTANGVR